MKDPVGDGTGFRKCDVAAERVNELLQELVYVSVQGEEIRPYFTINVLGYGQSIDSAFATQLAGRLNIPIADIAHGAMITTRLDDHGNTVEVPVWIPPRHGGNTPMSGALLRAKELIEPWAATHRESFPPIVINITDGMATDGDPLAAASLLKEIGTEDGKCLLFNVHVSNDPSPPVEFPAAPPMLSDEQQRHFAGRLFAMSSELPEKLRQAANALYLTNMQPGAKAFVFNGSATSVAMALDVGTFILTQESYG